jgi:hypothetical protein
MYMVSLPLFVMRMMPEMLTMWVSRAVWILTYVRLKAKDPEARGEDVGCSIGCRAAASNTED